MPDDLRRRAEALALLRALIARHEEAETRVFWPMVRERLPDGDTLAQDGLEQERGLGEASAALGEAGNGDSVAAQADDDLVADLVNKLRKHLAFEDVVLARVYDTVGEGERTDLGRRFKAARRVSGSVQEVSPS